MLTDRLALYREVAAKRGRPLIVFVTSSRANAGGTIAGDMVPEFLQQLDSLPKDADALDLLLVSNGGDPTVAWRLVTLIREKVSKFSVLVPQAAYSAATLVALGADEIVMHPHGNLGPTDPQISRRRPQRGDTPGDTIRFSSEDVSAFLKFIREEVGLTDQTELLNAFSQFSDEVGAVALATAARSGQLMLNMGEKLLKLHLDQGIDGQQARAISENLTKDYFHHGYPVSRSEAQALGLPIAESDRAIESLIWKIWLDLSEELEIRHPFDPVTVLKSNQQCQPLFAPIQMVNIPAGLPPDIQNQIAGQIAQNLQIQQVPPAAYTTIHAIMESEHLASRYTQDGLVFGSRSYDGNLSVSQVVERQGWVDLSIEDKSKKNKKKKKSVKKKTTRKKKTTS